MRTSARASVVLIKFLQYKKSIKNPLRRNDRKDYCLYIQFLYPRLEIRKRLAAQKVDMQVSNGLTAVCALVDDYAIAVL